MTDDFVDPTEPDETAPVPPPLPAKDSWKQLLIYRSGRGAQRGVIEPNSINNMITIVTNDPQWRGVFVKDEFTGDILVHRCPPWEDDSKFAIHRITHTDIVKAAGALEWHGLNAGVDKVHNVIKCVAEENRIHPLREHLDSLVWDGDARLDTWLRDVLGASAQNPEYLALVGSKWMIAAVRRIFQPGCKFDNMIVLEGPQGLGKSYSLRTLATFGSDPEMEAFTDAIKFADISQPAIIKMLQGKLIVEVAELAGMNRRDLEDVKNWITIQVDEIQHKYENEITKYPRQFVLAGTTNEDHWMRDPTGNRRFLPVRLQRKVDIAHLREVREQLWAEAVYRHKSGESIDVNYDEHMAALTSAEQASRMVEDVWTDAILAFVDNVKYVTTAEVLQSLSVDIGRRDELAARRVARVLKAAGWKAVQRRPVPGAAPKRMWENPKVDTMEGLLEAIPVSDFDKHA